MASTYSNLKIQLMATGENSGTWGNVTNDNLGVAIEQALVETATVTFASANVTLTLSNTNAAQDARALRLNLTGTTGGARDLIVPAIQKPYIVNNGTADTITVKVSGQTGVAVPAGRSYLLYNNGTDVVNAIEGMSVVSGGTGLETLTAESVVIGNGTNAVKFVAPGTTANVLTSNGTAWTSAAPPASNNASALTTGITAVNVGGTGANTLTSENVIIGNGTSAVKFVAPGSNGNVLTSNGTAWTSAAAAAGGGDYIMQVYTSPATWTKPAGLKAVKVTVVGGGGNGGNGDPNGCGGGGGPGGNGGGALRYIDAPLIPGPISVTIGGPAGTSSFGPLASATGGGNGTNGTPNVPGSSGSGGSGSGGTLNMSGQAGFPAAAGSVYTYAASFGFGGGHNMFPAQNTPGVKAGNVYGGGATGGSNGGFGPGQVGGTGAQGIVVVEEFY